MRIFIDMDGTLANFHQEERYLERMFEKGFFENLEPYDNMVDFTRQLARTAGCEVFILSAAVEGEPPYCKVEKHAWLDKHLPEIDREHRIFTDIGIPKSQYIPGGITADDILIDDYNKGLDEWQRDGGTSVKCKNDINHKGLIGTLWQGKLIDNMQPADDILRDFEAQVFSSSKNSITKKVKR